MSSHQTNRPVNATPVSAVAVSPVSGVSFNARIEEFSVTSDSVVATARIVVSAATRRIEVDWGDETSDVIRVRPGSVDLPAPGTDPLPEGTYELEHEYALSEDGRAFDHFVVARTDDADGGFDIKIRQITLRPRFKIVHYPMSVRLADNCDPFYNASVRIDVVQTIDGDLTNVYVWEPSNTFFSPALFFLLENSGTSFEVEVPPFGQASETKLVAFDFTEKDDFTADERNRIVQVLRFDPRVLEGPVSERVELQNDQGCSIIYAYGREVTLLRLRKQTGVGGVFAPL